jgi:hypothetical protein
VTVFIGISFGTAMSSSPPHLEEARKHALLAIRERSSAMGISRVLNALRGVSIASMNSYLKPIKLPSLKQMGFHLAN